MLTCSYCQRTDFKKPQGLSGHIRMKHREAEVSHNAPEQGQPSLWYQSSERIEEMADALADAIKNKSSGWIKDVYDRMDFTAAVRGAMLQAVEKVYGRPTQ